MTKTLRRVISVVAALAVVMLMAVPFGVAPTAPEKAWGATGKIEITPPDNTQSGTTNTYSIYKVFDAVGNGASISYRVRDGRPLTEGMKTYFDVDTAGNVTAKDAAKDESGNLTAGAVSAIAEYVKDVQEVATATSSGTNVATAENLDNGYYYITTSTGSVVTITSTNPNALVKDKNTVPSVTKKITNVEDNAGSVTTDGLAAIVQAGKKVTYTATVTFGKGSKNVKFHDEMDSTLTLDASDPTVVIKNAQGTEISGDNLYTVRQTPDTGDTLTISFADGRAEGDIATITYSAAVNSSALNANPAKNDAWVSYGDKPSNTSHAQTEVYNGQFQVTKHDGQGAALAGAGFVLKNSNNLYYKLDGQTVSWVGSIDDATEYKSVESTGIVPAFVGLPSGSYTVVEKTVPEGYNKAPDYKFEIDGVSAVTSAQAKAAAQNNVGGQLNLDAETSSIQNLNKATTIVNQAGSALPTTGGPGTTLLYAIGAILVLAAGVGLVARRRMRQH